MWFRAPGLAQKGTAYIAMKQLDLLSEAQLPDLPHQQPAHTRSAAQPVAAELPSAAKKGPFHIPSLDGIRAFSFLIVFVSHAGLGQLIPGGFGVTIFFFLSGYLITTLLRMEFVKTHQIDLRQFYLRRILRIFPPFYTVLGLAIVLTLAGVINGSLLPAAVFSQLSYLNNFYAILFGFDGQAPGTGIYWSLAVEEHFYLIFPALYILLCRYISSRQRQAFTLALICLVVLVWRCVLVYWLGSAENRTYIATDTRIDSILFGCMLAVFGNPVLDQTRVPERWWMWFWLPLGIGGLVFSLLYRDPQFRETFRYTIQGVALFPVFIAAIRYHKHPIFAILNLNWVRFIGTLSYSLYLVHFVVITALLQIPNLNPVLEGFLALTLSLILAVAMYYAIEQPSARFRRRLAHAGS